MAATRWRRSHAAGLSPTIPKTSGPPDGRGGSERRPANAKKQELVVQRERLSRRQLGPDDFAPPATQRAPAQVLDEDPAAPRRRQAKLRPRDPRRGERFGG